MSTILVSRHQAVKEWINQQGIHIDQHQPHFEIGQAKAGDTVIGNLPIGMVAQLNKDNIKYLHMEMTIPFSHRGKELSLDEMNQFNAKLVSYQVTEQVPQSS